MNKTVIGKQCTVLWHIDDLRSSHVNDRMNESVLMGLNKRYGKETPLTVIQGDILPGYLGMTLDYSTTSKQGGCLNSGLH